MHVPDPLVLSIDFPVLVIEVSQEYHLEQVISQKLVHDASQWEVHPFFFLRWVEDDEFVNADEPYVDVKQNWNEC